MNKTATVKKFHQFIHVEKGPVNCAVIDLLKSNVYHVENEIVEKLEKGADREIPGFIKAAEEEELIMDIDPNHWIPELKLDPEPGEEDNETGMELHLDEGLDVYLDTLLKVFKHYSIYKIVYYGRETPQTRQYREKLVFKKKDFQVCEKMACMDGDFQQITAASYLFNRRYNSCWGTKIAVTGDRKIRPCIFSEVIVGDLADLVNGELDADDLIEKMKEYWTLAKDKVKTCKDCELRHACFDCREIARRRNNDLLAANPYCLYDPYKGTWKPKEG
ncbi:MAG: hypothetical protein NT166_19040 [Candidatus Aminicenantes bacterium]|nr:hypothetical protein [Candidatus Aminicenantes bacterium]